MARQSINVNPTLKEFEAYMDFSGGVNTETSNERLLDNEFTQMINVELGKRGTVKKRTGYSSVSSFPSEATPTLVQGMFFFYRKNQLNPEVPLDPDIIFVKNGFFYVKEYNSTTISALNFPKIQTTKIVEAVQYYDDLYVATGDSSVGLVKINYNSGWTVSSVTSYEPNSQELKFIGLNALFGQAMQNTNSSGLTASEFQVKGIVFKQDSSQKYIVNGQKDDQIKLESYVLHNTSVSGYTPTQNVYQFWYRKSDTTDIETYEQYPSSTIPSGTSIQVVKSGSTYDVGENKIRVFYKGVELELGHDFEEVSNTSIELKKQINAGEAIVTKYTPSWRNTSSKYGTINSANTGNSTTFTPLETGLYDFKVVVCFKVNGSCVLKNGVQPEFIYDNFEVKSAYGKNDVLEQKTGGIKSCNRIRLHFERLILFGDTDEPTQVYFSHLATPSYFPTVNTFRFDTGKKEPIVTIERIQNYLAVFTKTTIHTILGINPSEYTLNLINDSVGCIAPRSAVLTANTITFLSQEGVFNLRPASFRLDQLNVQRVDTKIKGEVPKDTNACAVSYDSQYILSFPDKNIVYRFYYEIGSWVKDKSDSLDFNQFLLYSQKLYATRKNGSLVLKDNAVYKDLNVNYDMIVETKYFDLSKSFNYKKLKKLYVLAKSYDNYDAEYKVKVYADSAIVLDPEIGYAHVVEYNGIYYSEWTSTIAPNIEFHQGSVFSEWVLGEDFLGGKPLDVQTTRVRGKCRRVKIQFINSQDKEVELFGFGLEFKLKKP